MALIKSISGIRGTIGGKTGESLSPVDIVKFSAAYGTWVKERCGKDRPHVVVGRDARRSGSMVSGLVISALRSLGIKVTDLGLASTPTVEVAVTDAGADGGIIVTASHNPSEWNALKLLDNAGEFLSASEGMKVLDLAEREDFVFVPDEQRGELETDDDSTSRHIEKILKLDNVDVDSIRNANFKVAIDCVNSVGGIIVPRLLQSLGVKNVSGINTVPDGNFAHNPEPLPENLQGLSDLVVASGSDLGIAVDPDVDRLALVCEDGTMFGEEYTLVSVADYVLETRKGSTVSNLSSTRALRDVAEKHGCSHYPAPVGEVNVVEEMKKRGAVIGGEGNGGVIYPGLHYGRDALAGIALFLSHLARKKMKCSELRKLYPDYYISKKKLTLDPRADFSIIAKAVREKNHDKLIDERDGLWIGHHNGWVQVRRSNTEPIMRIYAEAPTKKEADAMADDIISIVENL